MTHKASLKVFNKSVVVVILICVKNIPFPLILPNILLILILHLFQEIQKIGSTHNRSARPFGGASATHAPAEDDRVPAVVHAQFNSPIGMYSNNNLVDTYSAQSKVLMADIDK